MNLNKVFIIGRLTVDPQLRATTGGQQVATLGIATNRTWMDKSGQKQEQVEFHNVVVWGKQAESVSQYLNKGSLLLVEGRLQTRSWQDKQGQQRKTTEIIADRVQFGPRQQGGSRPDSQNQPSAKNEIPTIDITEGETEIKESDLQF